MFPGVRSSCSLWSSLYCALSSLWVGLDGWLVKVSWLGKLVSVFWWVSWISSLCSAMKHPVMSYEMSVGGVTLGSLYIEAQGYVAGEFAWYVFLWNLLALGWCLVSV